MCYIPFLLVPFFLVDKLAAAFEEVDGGLYQAETPKHNQPDGDFVLALTVTQIDGTWGGVGGGGGEAELNILRLYSKWNLSSSSCPK